MSEDPSFSWIEIALSAASKRELVLKWDESAKVFTARLEFLDLSQFCQGIGETPCSAMRALDMALCEDAADEMQKAGVV